MTEDRKQQDGGNQHKHLDREPIDVLNILFLSKPASYLHLAEAKKWRL